MKKIGIFLFGIVFTLININVLNAKMEYKDLTETLKSEEITPLYSKLSDDNNRVIVDYFYIAGESDSLEFLNYANEIFNEYGDLFEVRCYEISKNEDNLNFMYNIIDYLKESYIEAPFIVLGETYFVAFNDNVKENFIKAVQENYLKDISERVYVTEQVRTRYYRSDVLLVGIPIGLLLMLIVGVVYGSISNKNKA